MASTDQNETLIRKLRKKLRQIENLERLNRPLLEEELTKVGKKTSIREHLHILLSALQQNGESQKDHLKEENLHEMYENVQDPPREGKALSPSQTGEELDLCENKSFYQELLTPQSKDTDHLQSSVSKNSDDQSGDQETLKKRPQLSKIASAPAERKESKRRRQGLALSQSVCRLSVLEGHNDLVTALIIIGDKLISTSRDTTIKCWDMKTQTELHSYGAHTETVTCVVVLNAEYAQKIDPNFVPNDHLIVSGSLDCSLILWSLTTGCMIKSIYTYNPVTQISYCHAVDKLISGSDGGKLELWDLTSGQNCFSVLAHDASVTGVKASDHTVYSCCSDGVIKVYQVSEEAHLSCVFVSENIKSASIENLIPRHIRCLEIGPRGILFGDDARNVKILDWRKGFVEKISNHSSAYSSTDAICCYDDLLVTSCYDLDLGLGYVNVRCNQTLEYLCSLDDKDTERIVSLGCGRTSNGTLMVVTGGMELKLWEFIPLASSPKRHENNIFPVKFKQALSRLAEDSESESSEEGEDEDSDENEDNWNKGMAKQGSLRFDAEDGSGAGWMSWCTVL